MRKNSREYTRSSRSLRTRRITGLLALALLLAAALLASLLFGARPIAFADAVQALINLPSLLDEPQSGSADARVIADLRWPRTLIGLFVGAALGVAGA